LYYLPLVLAFMTMGVLLLGTFFQVVRPFKISFNHDEEIKRLSIIFLHVALILTTTTMIGINNQSGKIIATIIGLYSLKWVIKK